MDHHDAAHQDVERIMRRAEAIGHDPQRVAHALDHRPLRAAAVQPVVDVKRPSALRGLARRLARGSAR
jgi:hypothetical protein